MKNIIKLLLVLIFSFSIVYAEGIDEERNICFPGVERSVENNYCVNKHWSINDSNLSNVMSVPYVNSQDKIYDYANLLSESEKAEIKQNIDDYTKKTGFDVAIIIVNEYMSDSANDVYAVDFYDYNDFGLKDNSKDYSGVIFIVNMNESNRYFNMFSFGSAQLYYSQSVIENILDVVLEDFIAGDYSKGLNTFVEECNRYYDNGKYYDNYYVDDDGMLHKKYVAPIGIALGGGALVTLITMIVLVKKNKMVKKANAAVEYLDKSSVNYSVKTDQFTGTFTTRHRISSDSSGGGGGGHSSIGSSGGGHTGGSGRHF